jgi:hypothetical protein
MLIIHSSLRAYRRSTVFAIALWAALACQAQEADPAAPSVTVSTLRNPVEKSYRKMVRGMDMFDRLHAMAPAASLRFRLIPKLDDTSMDGIDIKIVGDSLSLPVVVAADRTFVLERNASALAEDASVMPNRKAASMTWRTDIRSPGLPPGTRRLGDLRLECRVGREAGLVSQGVPVLSALVGMIRSVIISDPCSGNGAHYFIFADRPVFNVTLVHGARRESMPSELLYPGRQVDKANLKYYDNQVLLDRTIYAPLADASWPDDTLLEFEDMEGRPAAAAGIAADAGTPVLAIKPAGTPGKDSRPASPEAALQAITPGTSTKAEVAASLGKATTVKFDSGYEVWVYKYGQRKSEAVLLFAPSGLVTKMRMRLVPDPAPAPAKPAS